MRTTTCILTLEGGHTIRARVSVARPEDRSAIAYEGDVRHLPFRVAEASTADLEFLFGEAGRTLRAELLVQSSGEYEITGA